MATHFPGSLRLLFLIEQFLIDLKKTFLFQYVLVEIFERLPI